MKVCPVCGHLNRLDELECEQDRVPLADVPPKDIAEAAEPKPVVGVEEKPPLRATTREKAWCAAKAALEFPWGQVEVGDRLNIGRDPDFSPLAHRLADNDNVSGRHAELFLKEGILHVRHVGTMNPTYVRGDAIKPGEEIMLADGDEISFSRHLTAKVLLGGP